MKFKISIENGIFLKRGRGTPGNEALRRVKKQAVAIKAVRPTRKSAGRENLSTKEDFSRLLGRGGVLEVIESFKLLSHLFHFLVIHHTSQDLPNCLSIRALSHHLH